VFNIFETARYWFKNLEFFVLDLYSVVGRVCLTEHSALFACVWITVYVDHLHKKHNCVVLVHGLEIPSLPTRECTSLILPLYFVRPRPLSEHCRDGSRLKLPVAECMYSNTKQKKAKQFRCARYIEIGKAGKSIGLDC